MTNLRPEEENIKMNDLQKAIEKTIRQQVSIEKI